MRTIPATTHECGLAMEEEGDIGAELARDGNDAIVERIDSRKLRIRLERSRRITRAATKSATCRDMLLDVDDERGTCRNHGTSASLLGSIDGTEDEVVTRVEVIDLAGERDVRSHARAQGIFRDVLGNVHAQHVMQVKLLEDGACVMVAVMRRIGYRQTQVDLGASFECQRP